MNASAPEVIPKANYIVPIIVLVLNVSSEFVLLGILAD